MSVDAFGIEKEFLPDLLKDVGAGHAQLPEFQRGSACYPQTGSSATSEETPSRTTPNRAESTQRTCSRSGRSSTLMTGRRHSKSTGTTTRQDQALEHVPPRGGPAL